MKSILGPPGLTVLASFARKGPLVAFDYDGTLAPVAEGWLAPRMRARTRFLLDRVARRYACAVISGRSRADVVRLVGDVVPLVVGNHGLEWPWPTREADRAARRVALWRAALDRELGALDGLYVEDKRCSLSIFYDRAPSRRRARGAILAAVGRLPGARALLAARHHLVNVVSRGALHKGDAVERARRHLRVGTAVFVGDDLTDEDAFRRSGPALLGIRVGRSPRSAAPYFLPGQRDIDPLLEALLEV